MRVWIFQTGEPMPHDADGSRPMRAVNLVEALLAAGHYVLLWTADFDHRQHQHRYGQNTEMRSGRLTVRYLHSPGYAKNVSVARMYDHSVMARALRSALSSLPTQHPDVAFVGYPPIEPANVLVKWLSDRRIPVVLDVKDAWPNVLLRAVPESVRPLGRVALRPYFGMMRRTFARATALSAMAEPFLDWSVAQAGRERSALDAAFPLTSRQTEVAPVDREVAGAWWRERGVASADRFTIGFVGTLHQSYAWDPVIEAARNQPECRFIIAGDGSMFDWLRERTSELPNVVMPGWISQAQAEVLADHCRVALIPIGQHADFEMSVPNKVYDAMAKGLPIMTSLTGPTRELVESLDIGFYYDPTRPGGLMGAVRSAMDDPRGLEEMGTRAQTAFLRNFTVERVYGDLVAHLERLVVQPS